MDEHAEDWLAPEWNAPAPVHALSTLRCASFGASSAPFDRLNLGIHCGDDAAAVERNRTVLAGAARLPSQPRWLRQVHGTRVMRFRAKECVAGELPEADASVTDVPGVVLAILTADCLPIVFCTEDGGVIAAAHAGWRGLAAGVLEATVAAMCTPASRVLAWLGPAAGPQAYEIGEDVRAAFVDADDGAAWAFVETRPGHWKVDLYALARRRLTAAGLTNISGGGLCTISDSARFFSHRRDGRSGRMATLVWIDPRV